MKTILWCSVVLVVFPYAIYPLLIHIMGLLRPRPVRAAQNYPTVTILIPAYNEAECIHATVLNKLEQNYPKEKLQIIVVSDGSTDRTDDIVKSISDRRITLLRREGREGKAAALNAAIKLAIGDIVIFSDANSIFDADAIRIMVENFADTDVGYVTGSLALVQGQRSTSATGGSTYLKFENFLRKLETTVGSVIGVNGGIDAIRRELYTEIPRELITDFVLPLTVIANGKRVIFDPRVRSVEVANSEIGPEYNMRVRVALRALQGLSYMKRLFNPFNCPLTSFCLVSHKLLRYFGFIFMLTALVSSLFVARGNDSYLLLLYVQLVGYSLAAIGLLRILPQWLRILTIIPTYVVMSNCAFLVAFGKVIRGEKMAIWRPRAG